MNRFLFWVSQNCASICRKLVESNKRPSAFSTLHSPFFYTQRSSEREKRRFPALIPILLPCKTLHIKSVTFVFALVLVTTNVKIQPDNGLHHDQARRSYSRTYHATVGNTHGTLTRGRFPPAPTGNQQGKSTRKIPHYTTFTLPVTQFLSLSDATVARKTP